MISFKNLVCPTCLSKDFEIAIAKTSKPRVIADCSKCTTRQSIWVKGWNREGWAKPSWDFMTFSEDYEVVN